MEFIRVDDWPPARTTDFRSNLEAGNVVFFPTTPFPLARDAQAFLRGLDFSGKAIHKNIAYRPAHDRVTGFDGSESDSERLLQVMRAYSTAVIAFVRELLPGYADSWKLDYASFRPLEENGRDLPLNKRNDLLHTDAFPSRPTNGDLILRVFTNIHPSKTRNWITTDPFPVLAERYARAAGLEHAISGTLLDRFAPALHRLGLPVVVRSPYDRFMLRFHEYLKRNADFQRSCPKYRFDFPPGSTWLTFTDVLPHSVHSGQYALEQTFLIAKRALAQPETAPVSVLERLSGHPLAFA